MSIERDERVRELLQQALSLLGEHEEELEAAPAPEPAAEAAPEAAAEAAGPEAGADVAEVITAIEVTPVAEAPPEAEATA